MGNPRGRPKRATGIRNDFDKIMKKPVSVREGGKSRRISGQQAVLWRLLEKAIQGDAKSAATIISTAMKHEAMRDPVAANEFSREVDDELIAEFIRRHQGKVS